MARRRAWLLLGTVLVGALALRLWSIDHGLPFVYNPDELKYFVPDAVQYFTEGYQPSRLGGNPPGYAYLLHGVYLVGLGGRSGVARVWAESPETLYLIGRIVAALLGTLTVWLVYAAAKRLFNRMTGLLAAALMAVAFLPVVYSRFALADVPQLAPLALSLIGSAGVLRRGRRVDYLVAGLGVGLAVATKYLAGLALLPLLAAAGLHLASPGRRRDALAGGVVAGLGAVAALFVAHPYLLLDPGGVRSQLPGLSGTPKVGTVESNGITFYGWVLTWGVGWVPTVLAGVGAALLVKRDRRAALLLVPGILLFTVFIGLRPRYFSRYLLPVFPLVILLAAYAAAEAIRAAARARARMAPVVAVALTAGLLSQSLFHAIHHVSVSGRTDTRVIAAAWMRENIPPGTAILLEPMWIPVGQSTKERNPRAGPQQNRSPWTLVDAPLLLQEAGLSPGTPLGGGIDVVGSYRKELVGILEDRGVCLVITSSNQRGRVTLTPQFAPEAAGFYRELDATGRVIHVVEPYPAGDQPPADRPEWASTLYHFAYQRPGPQIQIYRLTGGVCETGTV